jgi:hypothetical protein
MEQEQTRRREPSVNNEEKLRKMKAALLLRVTQRNVRLRTTGVSVWQSPTAETAALVC